VSKPRPSLEQRIEKLQEGFFGPPREFSEADPIEPTAMAVPIDRILEYDRNPRRERNEAYDEIETSIRRRGFVGTLPITRRPGEPHFRVAEGGNTVLRILKHLYEETQDPRFHTIQCLFEPWVSESETLIAHLVENDARGELLFIDRARAVRELRGLIEVEHGVALSANRLAGLLRERGYSIDQPTIGRLEYAAEWLFPVIPKALRAGMGRPAVDQIRGLERRLLGLLEHRKCEPARIEEAKRWFPGCLARHDSDRWLIEPVQRELEGHLAELLGDSIEKVRANLQSIAGHGGPDADNPPARPSAVPSPRLAGAEVPPVPSSSAPDLDPERIAEAGSINDTDRMPARSRTPARDPKPQGRPDLPRDLKSLRGRMWTLASQLASRSGLSDCILICPKGCGYLVDLPSEPLCATGRPETVKEVERLTIWWLLSTFADQWPFGPGIQGVPALAHLEDSRMYPVLQAAAAEDAGTLSSILVPFVDEPPMFARLCQYLFAVLEDQNFEIVMRLIETRWALQAHCRRLGKKWVWDL
jgi:ParB family protein of integrating conjugative element (PFGI_1 class)